MGTMLPTFLPNLSPPADTRSPTLRCENCGADKPPSDIALLWVHNAPPDDFSPRLMFICDDCNITLTEQGCRLVTLSDSLEQASALGQSARRVREEFDYPFLGTGGG